ncbi:50S ribosome-binding GTPase [Candidatus Sumerlaeota bacterium]|nr:50S ribosome-binding GTPase [Candidatus Sumerlaeota bacterium]
MPANLTPEYLEAERAFREAKTDEEKLRCLERMLATIPKHKGTEKMQADIKRKISKFKERIELAKKRTKKGRSFKVPPEGAGQIAFIGPPNAGKSTLLRRLTNATVEVAEYPFTTTHPAPGMMAYENIQIQLIDLPPVCEEHTDPWVIEIARAADSVALILDIAADDVLERVDYILDRFDRAKLALVGKDTREPPWPYVARPTFIVANKIDLPQARIHLELLREHLHEKYEIFPISALDDRANLDELKNALYRVLNIIRVYSKEPGKPPDLGQPFTIPAGSTVLDLAREIHKDFVRNLKFARIWGSSRFDGQTVQRDYVLQDGDVVEIHLYKRYGDS